jgi:hypothetical protein
MECMLRRFRVMYINWAYTDVLIRWMKRINAQSLPLIFVEGCR